MIASRRTQPYRKGQPRQAGLALKAMGKGRTATGFNPADIQRGLQKGASGARQMHKPVDLTPAPAKGVAPSPKSREQRMASRARRVAAGRKVAQATRPDNSAANFHRAKGPEVLNTSGKRKDRVYKSVAGFSSKGEAGSWHVYDNGERVFVRKPSGRQSKARRFADAVKAPAKGASR